MRICSFKKLFSHTVFVVAFLFSLSVFVATASAGISELEKNLDRGATAESAQSASSAGTAPIIAPYAPVNTTTSSSASSRQGVVNDDDPAGLNVRSAPWGKVIGNLKKGAPVEILGREGDWYRIRYNGGSAFVYAALIKTSTPPSSASAPSATTASASTPYFNQYDNRYSPSATCQNTSVAMVLAKYGWRGTPDDITARFGRYMGQTPSGLASIFNTLASESGLRVRLRAHTNMTPSKIISLLSEGKPVITHGWFTGSGHVVTLIGYDGTNFKVNDPAGRWVQRYMGGYDSYASGKGVLYNKNRVYDAILEGGTAWAHEVYEI